MTSTPFPSLASPTGYDADATHALPHRGHGPAASTLTRIGLYESIWYVVGTLAFVAFLIVSLYVTGWVRFQGIDLPTPARAFSAGLPVVLFIYGIVTVASYLRPVLAAGATRGAVARALGRLAITLGAGGVLIALVISVIEVPLGSGLWSPQGGPAEMATRALPLFLAVVAAVVSGALIALTFLRLPWWAAILLIPVTSPVITGVALAPVVAVQQAPGTSLLDPILPLVITAAVVVVHALLGVLLLRSLSVRVVLDRP